MDITTNITVKTTDFERRAAGALLRSLDFYGYSSPPVAAAGGPATPAYFANRLGKILNARGDQLPGTASDWWGTRWERYACQLLAGRG